MQAKHKTGWSCCHSIAKATSDAHTNRARGKIGIVREPSATGSSMLFKKDKLDERSVIEIVKDIGFFFVPPGNMSGAELYCMIHCISTTFDPVGFQTALSMPAETDILKNSLLLLLHLARVSARFHAKLKVFKHFNARRITVNTFYLVVKPRINRAQTRTL